MKSLWERAPKRGECGKAAVRGLAIGVLVAAAAVVASLMGLV